MTPFRRVKAVVNINGVNREMVFVTNNLTWSARTIADLYKARYLKLTAKWSGSYGIAERPKGSGGWKNFDGRKAASLKRLLTTHKMCDMIEDGIILGRKAIIMLKKAA